ncbi:MAG: YbaK/EbsC family protein [Gammaproteobacteria bacterium]
MTKFKGKWAKGEATMILQKVRDYLNQQHISYETIQHAPAYTAQEIAAIAHIHGKELAKTVIVKVDGKLVMVLEPAHLKVNLARLQEQLSAKKVELASERDFKGRFPECELGAMPPFGNLYDMDVYIDKTLTDGKEIAFNGGTHAELIKMSYRDFERLVHPKMVVH